MRRDTRKRRIAARKDLTDATAMREFYARLTPRERDEFLRDNPSFKTSDHSALTVLQWREHARIRGARGTREAQRYADQVRAATGLETRARLGTLDTYSELRPTRGGAAFLTLCGLGMKGALFGPIAYVVGGLGALVVFGVAFTIYATLLTLGSIMSARAL